MLEPGFNLQSIPSLDCRRLYIRTYQDTTYHMLTSKDSKLSGVVQ